ncbi:MAG: hypothetical protein CYG60_26005, partial [Actinobacteria bacterium]
MTKPKALIYARVSTQEQARKDLSIPGQVSDLEAWADALGYEVAGTYTDPGHSGESWDRPGMDALRRRVGEGGIAAVLVRDRDRISRDGGVFAGVLAREFGPKNTAILALHAKGDGSLEGDLLDRMLDQFAWWELQKTRERTRRGKLQRARNGEVPPGRYAPWGYAYEKGEAKGTGTYRVDPAAMSHVRRLFEIVGAEGRSMSAAKREFEAAGVRPPGDGRHWHVSTLRRIIDDPVYEEHARADLEGLVASGNLRADVLARLDPAKTYSVYWFNRSRVKRVHTGERVVAVSPNDASEHVAVPVEGSGVPAAWIEQARAAVAKNAKPSFAGGEKKELSGGLLRCPCGSAATVFTRRDARAGGERVFYYVCGAYRRHGVSDTEHCRRYHRADDLEPRVREFAYRLLSNPEALREKVLAGLEGEAGERERADEEARALHVLVAEAEGERDRYTRLYARGALSDDEYDGYVAETEARKRGARERLAALERPRSRGAALLDDLALLDEFLRNLPDLLGGAAGYRWAYEALGLGFVAHRDGTLVAMWSFAPAPKVLPPGEPVPGWLPAPKEAARCDSLRSSRGERHGDHVHR